MQLLGRVETQQPFSVAGINDYYLQLPNTGAWSIVKSTTSATLTTLKSGTVAAPGTGTWHNLALTFKGSTITVAIDGTTVGTVTGTSYPTGQVGLGINGYQTDEFDNLSITPVDSAPVADTYQLLNRNSGQALAVSGNSTTAGALIVQSPAAVSTAQQWQLTSTNGQVTLVNAASNLALDVPGSSKTQGTQLDQATNSGGANQHWTVNSTADGYYTLTAGNSGMLADVDNNSTTAGASVVQWPANGGLNQQWLLNFDY
ncbi:MAG TPA: RICIN domain-containing protein [Actinocrinis sp.]|nr:RICIN domain-containing protein [Actinocrinis sp.]